MRLTKCTPLCFSSSGCLVSVQLGAAIFLFVFAFLKISYWFDFANLFDQDMIMSCLLQSWYFEKVSIPMTIRCYALFEVLSLKIHLRYSRWSLFIASSLLVSFLDFLCDKFFYDSSNSRVLELGLFLLAIEHYGEYYERETGHRLVSRFESWYLWHFYCSASFWQLVHSLF